MKNHYPKVKVFITKDKKFRAQVKLAKNEPKFGVTVGGEQWNKGLVSGELEKKIIDMCQSTIDKLSLQLSTVAVQHLTKYSRSYSINSKREMLGFPPLRDTNTYIEQGEKKSRCCGRCDGHSDICFSDMICDNHNITGCEQCFGKR